MAILSQVDLADLQSKFESLETSFLSGILVVEGSMTLRFSKTTILVRCPFEVKGEKDSSRGCGTSPETSAIMFQFFNQNVMSTDVNRYGEATLVFENGHSIRIIPDDSGSESYVLTTPTGAFPVS